jgi:glycosyltransferase involved in cell wall biosynthesis
MEAFELVFVISWAATYGFFAFFTWRKNSLQNKDVIGGFPLSELTVIIPFRNEYDNLEKLCKSLISQKEKPEYLFFIDDHSSDGGAEFIENQMANSGYAYEIIQMKVGNFGKKSAIMDAVNLAKTTYCQTMDADVWFEPDFFKNLPKPEDQEMLILPVRMLGNTGLTKIFELEYGSFQILQANVRRSKPLMASGANLIFSRNTYLKINQLASHAHRSSGDDQYALAQFISSNKKMAAFFDPRLAVLTQTPENFRSLLLQRVRWMGNNTQGNDWRALLLTLLLFTLNTSFLLLFLKFAFVANLLLVFVLLGLKCGLDLLIYSAWFSRNKTWYLLPWLPFLSVLYPLYLLVLPASFLFTKNSLQWKQRMVKH